MGCSLSEPGDTLDVHIARNARAQSSCSSASPCAYSKSSAAEPARISDPPTCSGCICAVAAHCHRDPGGSASIAAVAAQAAAGLFDVEDDDEVLGLDFFGRADGADRLAAVLDRLCRGDLPLAPKFSPACSSTSPPSHVRGIFTAPPAAVEPLMTARRDPRRKNCETVKLIWTLDYVPSERTQAIIEKVGNITDFYNLKPGKDLGNGNFGSVRRATVVTNPRAERAVKLISKALMKNQIGLLRKEIEVTKMVDHPNIIKLHAIFEDALCVYFVMELCSGGTLMQRLNAAGHFTESRTAIVMRQVLRAVNYLHRSLVCHRDIKPENCLIDSGSSISSDRSRNNIKLTDFGLSTTFVEGEFLTSAVGTASHMAPEVIDRWYNHACDIWSCGVMMFTLLGGLLPFSGATDEEIKERVKRARYSFASSGWVDVTQSGITTMTDMLCVDLHARSTAAKVLQSKWFAQTGQETSVAPLRADLISALRGFRCFSKLKQAALRLIVTQLSEEQISESRQAFITLDLDGDGILSLDELQLALEIEVTKATSADRISIVRIILVEVEAMLEETSSMTTTEQTYFTYTEFLAATFNRDRVIKQDICKMAFAALDKNGDGRISRDELEGHVLGRLSAEELQALVEEIDENGDGHIDFQEFLKMMRS